MTSGVKFQRNEARTIYHLATGELTWDKLNEQGKRSIARKPDLMKAIDLNNKDIVPLIAINRLIDYIRRGKITFDESYYFQDIGERLRNVDLNLEDCYLTTKILNQFIDGTYQINGFQLFDLATTEIVPIIVPSSHTLNRFLKLCHTIRRVPIRYE